MKQRIIQNNIILFFILIIIVVFYLINDFLYIIEGLENNSNIQQNINKLEEDISNIIFDTINKIDIFNNTYKNNINQFDLQNFNTNKSILLKYINDNIIIMKKTYDSIRVQVSNITNTINNLQQQIKNIDNQNNILEDSKNNFFVKLNDLTTKIQNYKNTYLPQIQNFKCEEVLRPEELDNSIFHICIGENCRFDKTNKRLIGGKIEVLPNTSGNIGLKTWTGTRRGHLVYIEPGFKCTFSRNDTRNLSNFISGYWNIIRNRLGANQAFGWDRAWDEGSNPVLGTVDLRGYTCTKA